MTAIERSREAVIIRIAPNHYIGSLTLFARGTHRRSSLLRYNRHAEVRRGRRAARRRRDMWQRGQA